jgi:hypothetical protein
MHDLSGQSRMIPVQTAALLASIGFLVLAAFQLALALGVPWGKAAWGGKSSVLPSNLRVASGVSMVVWLFAALVVLDRAGTPVADLPDVLSAPLTWLLVPLLVVGALMNIASSSPYERFGWAPTALLMALLTLVVALG